jgi:hypothetical protein
MFKIQSEALSRTMECLVALNLNPWHAVPAKRLDVHAKIP